MSEYDATPTLIFSTRTNTELGAQGVELADDGTIILDGGPQKGHRVDADVLPP